MVSTPDPPCSLYSCALFKLSLKDREVVGSNPTHGVLFGLSPLILARDGCLV